MFGSIALAATLAASIMSPHAWSSANPQAVHGFSDTVYVRNNVFTVEGPQTVWADSRNSFGITTRQPRGNTAVLSYPSRQDLEYIKISRLRALRANFRVNMPKRGDYETAFDIWVQPNGDPQDWNNNVEVMIWVNNHGQTPAGNITDHAVTQYGQKFTLWRDGGKDKPNTTYSLVLDHPQKHGTMHILSVFRWMESHGYFPASSGLNDVEFGWEVCSTGGVTETFSAHYALHQRLR
jgi:hypothetical protein